MSILTAIRHLTVTTPIPSSARTSFKPTAYTQALHDHGFLLTLAPLVSSTKPIAMPASLLTSTPLFDRRGSVDVHATMACYEVVEDLALGRKFTMVLAFDDVEDGTACVLTAAGGLRVDSWTRVVRREKGAEEQEEDGDGVQGWELSEQLRLQGNRLLLPLVASSVVKARKAVHEGLIERVEKEGKE